MILIKENQVLYQIHQSCYPSWAIVPWKRTRTCLSYIFIRFRQSQIVSLTKLPEEKEPVSLQRFNAQELQPWLQWKEQEATLFPQELQPWHLRNGSMIRWVAHDHRQQAQEIDRPRLNEEIKMMMMMSIRCVQHCSVILLKERSRRVRKVFQTWYD